MAFLTGRFQSNNLEDTKKIASNLAKAIESSAIFAFYGDLGSGKTTFIQTVLQEFNIPLHQIQSPTFSYLHTYENCENDLTLHHFDLYRLKSENDFFSLGFDEYLAGEDICFIEWAEKIDTVLPKEKTVKIRISHISETKREIEVSNA